ncbi:MAG: VTT domain-containing protein [Paracoccaceae bacterium]
MTDAFFEIMSDWGVFALALITFLSCLALPVPSSLSMMAAGAFGASGDIDLASAIAAAFVGAVAGDQVGFLIGRYGHDRLRGWLDRNATRRAILAKAQTMIARHGSQAVFLTRWMFSAVGPYVNVIAGGAGMAWARFTTMGVLGEAVWVGLYVGIGYFAGGQMTQIADLLGNLTGLLTSVLVAALLGAALWRRRHD